MKNTVALFLLTQTAWASDPSTFFANKPFHENNPGATALHAKSKLFVIKSYRATLKAGDELIAAILKQPTLASDVAHFPALSEDKRIKVMKSVFKIETQLSGTLPPELILDRDAKKETFFDFDPAKPGPGRVILNPTKLFADTNAYAGLLFLIHETRHSFEFQVGFEENKNHASYLVNAYHAGFVAQKNVFDQGLKVSFCDFLTLNQEYEAFLFGNYVMKALTNGAVDTSGMGTLASQYVPGKGLRLDLAKLLKQTPPENVFDAFNELEKVQFNERQNKTEKK